VHLPSRTRPLRTSQCPPIIFLVFNRPEQTRRVFERIRQARPRQLFVVADGPRSGNPSDPERCQQVRAIIDNVDWECEVIREYSAVNLGCGQRVSSGITAGLELLDEAIILEDDCLPDVSFFEFCRQMLDRYRADPSVMQIAGSLPIPNRGNSSYFFAYSGGIWGWATWRRAWRLYDFQLSALQASLVSGVLREAFHTEEALATWVNHFRHFESNQNPSTWDVQWYFSRLVNRGLSVIPRMNLIENIGFGVEATHTNVSARYQKLEARSLNPNLSHPNSVVCDSGYDVRVFREMFQVEMPELTLLEYLQYGIRNRWRLLFTKNG
jgi:hypothetical protein